MRMISQFFPYGHLYFVSVDRTHPQKLFGLSKVESKLETKVESNVKSKVDAELESVVVESKLKFKFHINWNKNENGNEGGGTCDWGASRPNVGSCTRFVFVFVFVSIYVKKFPWVSFWPKNKI